VEFGAELETVGKRSAGQVQPVNRSIGITAQTGKNRRNFLRIEF